MKVIKKSCYKKKVIRTNYRVLNPEEEALDVQTQELWKSFLSKLQDSVEFVNVQSPNILEQLDALLKVNKRVYFIKQIIKHFFKIK